MTVRMHATKSFKHLSVPVSYKVLDPDNLVDSRNVFDNKGVTETRYGIKRFNTTSLGGPILSLSYFKLSNGTAFRIAKVGTVLYSVSASGAATAIKSGLSATTKHRAVTFNDRHIIVIESDGVFSYNGTTFAALGQAAPVAAVITPTAGGSLPPTINWQVGLTYYSTSTGFESNVSESNVVASSAGNKTISVAAVPASATNGTIDKVRIYLKNLGATDVISANPYLFVAEVAFGATYTIDKISISTITPPTKNGLPPSGGAKYIALYGKKIAIAGNATFASEVFISEPYLPDAFDDNADSRVVLQAAGQGPITGLEVGFYNQQFLNPYIALFKKATISIYSELNDRPELAVIDAHLGCISQDTIKVRNGTIAFMSDNGWYVITNGNLAKDQNGIPVRLGNGTINDIFSRPGWSNELNIPQGSTFFSAYHFPDAQYLTFVCEGANTEIKKAYVYEERINGFRVFEFLTPLTCAIEAEDDNGYQVVMLGDQTGTIFTYSSRNPRHDEDYGGNPQAIPTYLLLPYIMPGEDANSYNFRTLTVRAIGSANPITVQVWPSFSQASFTSIEYDFPNNATGFVLDHSKLDIDSFGDERTPVTHICDINLTGETLLIGFFQNIIDSNIYLISAQLSMNKNGSRAGL